MHEKSISGNTTYPALVGNIIARLRKEKEKLERDLSMLDKKLSNKDFVSKAKEDVVSRTRDRRETLQTELSKIEESLDIIASQN